MTTEIQKLVNTLETHQVFNAAEYNIKEFYHEFKGFGIHKSRIKVSIINPMADGTLVILQDLGEGTSVTNASEQLATEIGRLENLDPATTIWVECYPYYGVDYGVDQIRYTYDHDRKEYSQPEWSPINNITFVERLREILTP